MTYATYCPQGRGLSEGEAESQAWRRMVYTYGALLGRAFGKPCTMPFSWWHMLMKIKTRVFRSAASAAHGLQSWSCTKTLVRRVQLQAAAAERTKREGDGRLTGKDVEEATTRVVLENPRDITSIPSTSALPRVLLLSEECVHTEQGVRGLLWNTVTQRHKAMI